MMVEVWVTVAIALITLFVGFWIGRSVKWMAEETEARIREVEEKNMQKGGSFAGKGVGFRKNSTGFVGAEWIIVSPVAGKVLPFFENNRCGVSIEPENECLYAPTAGRVKKLFPMGNSMLIVADSGPEIRLSVGRGVDELFNGYYRPRVVQSEIIPKGKLLLEFDREALEKEGVAVMVDVSVEQVWNDKSVMVTQGERVRAGEALLWV